MQERQVRTFAADLELRGDGRTVVGLAVPFDQPTDLGPYIEVFRRGAFARTIAERGNRVKLLVEHQRDVAPIGRATSLVEDAAGLRATFRVSKTAAGDEAIELIRDGALDGLSIAFRPVTDRWAADRSTVERTEVALYEVSATGFPAYAGAEIAAIRSVVDTTRGVSPAEARRRLDALTRNTTALPISEAATRLARLTRGTP